MEDNLNKYSYEILKNYLISNNLIKYNNASCTFNIWEGDKSFTTFITKDFLLLKGFKSNEYQNEFTFNGVTLDCEYTDENTWNVLYNDENIGIEIKYINELNDIYYKLTKRGLYE